MLAMFLFILELLVTETLFCWREQRRKGFAGVLLLCVLLAWGYLWFVPLTHMGVLIHVPLYAISLLYLFGCYRLSTSVGLFISTASCTLNAIASLLSSILTLFFPEQFTHFGVDIAPNGLAYAMMFGCYLLVLLVALQALIRPLAGIRLHRLATVPIVAISLAMLVINQFLGMFFELYAAPDASFSLHLLEYVWNLFCCIFCLCIQFNLFSLSKLDEELEVTRHLIAEKERQYQVSKTTMEAINHKCHDLKYQLSALSSGQGGQKQIDEAMALVDSFDTALHTGNETLDVIFTEKNDYCKQAQITFVCMIDGAKLDFMEVTDQYVLFGNMIDNAINAVSKLPEGMERPIYLNVHAEKKLLLIQTENPFTGEVTFQDGLPKTSSGDEFNHGFGMKSIRLIAEKYHGSVSSRAKDGTFYVNVVIPL
jgi:hypothetical protein